ncbi:MAG: type VI secretion system baseplate subunit TssE [Rhodobacteraceae bacterium]|jgi:type VI secretion system protein ImpF|nr:type VI secretion system baseplate subunit TssE [Paracoccaceae bacterium]
MADLTLSERLQPSLLDRLTDRNPELLKETRDSRVIDMRRLRDILQRDLGWLLNTFDNSPMIPAEEYPHAAASTLNYGVHEVAGEFASATRVRLMRGAIFQAIERFEPRIRAETLHVELRANEDGSTATIGFDIRAEMWAQPLPMELYLRSAVDVITGEVRLDRPAEGLRTLRGAGAASAVERGG